MSEDEHAIHLSQFGVHTSNNLHMCLSSTSHHYVVKIDDTMASEKAQE